MTTVKCPNCHKDFQIVDGFWAFNNSSTGENCTHCGIKLFVYLRLELKTPAQEFNRPQQDSDFNHWLDESRMENEGGIPQ